MGMYTQLETHFLLKKDTPKDVVSVLKIMVSDVDIDITELPKSIKHELFNTERWSWMFSCGSTYFDDYEDPTLIETEDGYILKTLSNFKNYGDELSKFVNFITPYVEKGLMKEGAYYSEWYEECSCATLNFLDEFHYAKRLLENQ